jgi:hypothetical protein
MGCIAIVCVLLFWFCYFGILAKLGGSVVESIFGFGAAGSGFPPSFQPLDSAAFADIIGDFPVNFSCFYVASSQPSRGFANGMVRAMFNIVCSLSLVPAGRTPIHRIHIFDLCRS